MTGSMYLFILYFFISKGGAAIHFYPGHPACPPKLYVKAGSEVEGRIKHCAYED